MYFLILLSIAILKWKDHPKWLLISPTTFNSVHIATIERNSITSSTFLNLFYYFLSSFLSSFPLLHIIHHQIKLNNTYWKDSPISLYLICYLPSSHLLTISPQIKLNNPTMRSLSYVASITGKDKHLFSLPSRDVFNLPRKAKV